MEALAMRLRARERRKLHQIEEALRRENPGLTKPALCPDSALLSEVVASLVGQR